MFSNLSENSILLATVTPSFVIFGDPNVCSITTLRPLGPNVVYTASASFSQPTNIFYLHSLPKLNSLAAKKKGNC